MPEPDPRPLNADLPEVETMRRLLADAERVSRELGELADEMSSRMRAGRRDAERLIAALDEARDALAGGGMKAEVDLPKAEPPPKATTSGSDGARMLARQMLANGADREVVARSLQTSFGVENADAVVDSVAGDG